jgi:uncharacterized protein
VETVEEHSPRGGGRPFPPASDGADLTSAVPLPVVASVAMGTVRVREFDAKAKANVRKHGVTFEEALAVFLDELAVPFEEGEHPDRLILVGESQLGRTILVVFTERVSSAIIRIISARRATKREQRAYVEED